MKNSKKIVEDNDKNIQSFKDATTNSIYTLSKAREKVDKLQSKLDRIKSGGDTKIQANIDALSDLVNLYLDKENKSHVWKTPNFLPDNNISYKNTLTSTIEATLYLGQFELSTWWNSDAASIFKTSRATPGVTPCTKDNNHTPICNFGNTNTDNPGAKPSLAFMDNFDAIYSVIMDETSQTCTPSCECGQFVASHCYIGKGYVSKNAPNYDCPDLINKGGSITAKTSMASKPLMKCDNTAGSSTNGCCFWGRGAVQVTGLRNYGIANQVITNNESTLSSLSLKKDTICSNPEIVCQDSTYQWFTTLTFWVNSVQGYTFPSDPTPEQTPYQTQLEAYITHDCPTDSVSLEPTPSTPSGTDCKAMQFVGYTDPKEMYPFAMGCFGAVNAGFWNGEAGSWYVRLKGFINIMNKLKAQTQYPFTASISSGSIKEIYAAAGMTTMEDIAKIMVDGNPLGCSDNSEVVPTKIPETFSINTLWGVLDAYTNLPVDSSSASTTINSQFWDKEDDHRYGAVGLAALLSNAFEETGNLATCDETNWGNTCDYCTNSAGVKCQNQ